MKITDRPCRTARSLGLPRLTALLLVPLLGACADDAIDVAPKPTYDVTVTTVKAADTPVVFELVGKTRSSRRVEVRSRVEGFLEKRVYTEGTLVQEGDVLFQMDRKPFEVSLQGAQAELKQQQARLDNANAYLERVKPAVEQGAVAKQELDDAFARQRSAAAAVEVARSNVVQAELNLGYTTIKAPVTGLSSFAVQREGAYIGIGSGGQLTYVAKIDPIWVEFSVSENQLLDYRRKFNAGVLAAPDNDDYEVRIILADGTAYPHVGRITFADASLSEETGTFLLRAELDNPDSDLRPGQFVRVHLVNAYRPGAILVPQRAVQQGAQGSFIWVVDADGKASPRPVVVGPLREDDWFIEKGLEDGETIVVDGALRLQPGVVVNVVTPEPPAGETAGEKAS